jgi:hypothetical protein
MANIKFSDIGDGRLFFFWGRVVPGRRNDAHLLKGNAYEKERNILFGAAMVPQEQRSSRSSANGPRQAVPPGAPNITDGIYVLLQGPPG